MCSHLFQFNKANLKNFSEYCCNEGWVSQYIYRKFIGLDGCHLRGSHRVELLCAIGTYANDDIYSIAYAVTKGESENSWLPFTNLMKKDLIMEQGES